MRKALQTLRKARWPLGKVRRPLRKVRWPLRKVRWPLRKARWPLQKVRWPLRKVRWPLRKALRRLRKVLEVIGQTIQRCVARLSCLSRPLSPSCLALHRVTLLLQARPDAVAQITLQFHGAIEDCAARTARALQLL